MSSVSVNPASGSNTDPKHIDISVTGMVPAKMLEVGTIGASETSTAEAATA